MTNPDAGLGDKAQRRGLYRAVEALGAAYYFFDEEKYAAKAAELIRVWFINVDTRMNPHMQYGQYVPGRNEGRPYGIIETRPFIRIVDAVQLLTGSNAWTDEDHTELQKWFAEYLDWLLISEWGQKESLNGNNHETACNLQIVSYALFVDRGDIADLIFQRFKNHIIFQIEPDGRMPREIARTKGLHYSCMNLSLMLHLAELAESQGVDLYSFQTLDGRSLSAAFDFLMPYIQIPEQWPYQQIETSQPDYDEIFYILRSAHKMNAAVNVEQILTERYGSGFASHRGQLYWPNAKDLK